MTFSRRFQRTAMIVCVAAMAWIFYTSRDGREFDDDVSMTPPPPPTATTPPSPPLAVVPATAQPPLPKSRAEILAALATRGFTLESFEPLQPIANVRGYRVAGIPAAVAFTERDGQLAMVDVAAVSAGAKANGPAVLDFAEIVGEVATGRSRDTTRQAIAQTMTALGKEPGRMSCSFGTGKDRFRLQLTRHDDRGYSFMFKAEKTGEARGER